MRFPHWIETSFFSVADFTMATLPRRCVSLSCLQHCRVISHRGESDNSQRLENTFAAFDPLVGSGVWAIELDIRWTCDLEPVVFHDANCQRVLQDDSVIAQLSLAELQQKFPMIPSLAELVQRYHGKLHLMIELKVEPWRDVAKQCQRLKTILAALTPQQDYHIISLDPLPMFAPLGFLPSGCLLPIVYTNVNEMANLAEQQHYGGVLGHYAFIHKALIQRCQQQQKAVGVGFINSKNSLLRELQRGVPWIYTNHALRIQAIIEQLKQEAS